MPTAVTLIDLIERVCNIKTLIKKIEATDYPENFQSAKEEVLDALRARVEVIEDK